MPAALRIERWKKLHKDDRCRRDKCGKLIGNHSLKKFKEHHVVAVFDKPFTEYAAALSFRFRARYNADEIEAVRSVLFDDCRIATKSINGRVVSFQLTHGFRVALYERDDNNVFWFIAEKVNNELENRDHREF